jgi:hypothetical protein
LGMVSHASLPAAWEVIGRRITVWGQPWAESVVLFKK